MDNHIKARDWAIIVVLLALTTLLAHIWSLNDALFLDDHWHQWQIRERGFSFNDLLQTTTLDPEQIIHTWWQEKPVRWQYARPLSVLIAKAVHHATGGSLPAQHAVSLVLHFSNACMVFYLCMLLTHSRFWSAVGGLLMVVYSHSIFAVGWLASQNTVLQTTLMMGALICYSRASGLQLFAGPLHKSISATTEKSSQNLLRLRVGWYLLTILLWFASLLARENAMMFPIIAIAFDLAFGGKRHLWSRRWAHTCIVLITCGYLGWRLVYFYHPYPEVYVRSWHEQGFVLWSFAKLLHYLCASFWLSPMTVGPSGRLFPWAESPGDCMLMVGILAVMGTGYYLATRRARGFWIWPLWVILAVLPVVPVLATPHSGYLSGVGFAVAMVIGPALRDKLQPIGIGRWAPGVAIWFLVATTSYMPIYRTTWAGMVAAEGYTVAHLSVGPPPDDETTDIFFINLPFVNIYAKLSLAEAWGPAVEQINCHVLTYAPHALLMDQPCRLEQLDDHRFSIAVQPEARPFFSRLLGRFLIDAFRRSGPFRQGELVRGEKFDVRIVEIDGEGVRKLEFTFRQPLDSGQYQFFLSTPACAATQVHFGRSVVVPETFENKILSVEDVDAAANRLMSCQIDGAQILLAAMQSADPQLRQAAWPPLQQVALRLASATASPIQDLLGVAEPSAADLAKIHQWWTRYVDEPALKRLWGGKMDFVSLKRRRDGLFTVHAITGMVIQTDLYLTGPPFPGPN